MRSRFPRNADADILSILSDKREEFVKVHKVGKLLAGQVTGVFI